MGNKVRVAAVQFGAGNDIDANLVKTLAMIDQAAKQKPDLMVLPEFVNHLSWYEDKAHCFKVSVALDSDFLAAIAAKAKEHNCYIVINCTVQREDDTATGSSMTYDPHGELVSVSDKQVLMGHENDYLKRAPAESPIIETPIGKIASYACMDGVINETPRILALRGAQILCNSLNSFAFDEASLHIPVRAAENKVFVVAANKVDPLIPEESVAFVSEATGVPAQFLDGAGESQIVAPDGTVLAKASLKGDAVVVADIDLSWADDKLRPDGTNVFANRRPELYGEIGAKPPADRVWEKGAPTLQTAVFQSQSDGEDAIEECADAVAQAITGGTQLIVLPELFCFENGVVQVDVDTAVSRSQQAINILTAALQASGSNAVVVTSLVERSGAGIQHVGVMISKDGVTHRQAQLHKSERHAGWVSTLGDGIQTMQMPWGKLAIVVGDDAIYPETFRLAVFAGADVVALPFHVMEQWELDLGLVERSAENRVCLVAASRPTEFGASLLTTLHKDFTIFTEWEKRPFDGTISHPLVTRAENEPGLTQLTVHPEATVNKVVSRNTDLVDGRPWYLAEAITSSNQ